jgi:HlyD family secretion protein
MNNKFLNKLLNNKKWLALALVALVVAAVVGYKRTHQEALPVKTARVDRGLVEATVANTKAGTVKACRRSKLSMRGGGVVDKLLVKKGDHVKEGQLLLELWNRDRRTNLSQANATLQASIVETEKACANENNDTTAPATSASVKAKTACELARAHQLVAEDVKRDVEDRLDKTQLRAPFAGVVAEINGEIGEYVTPSPPGVLTPPAVDLIDDSCLYVTAPIDEVDAGQLHIGMNVNVTLDAFRNRSFAGQLTRIAPYVVELEKQARTVDIDVKLSDPPEDVKLLIGYSADTTVVLDQKQNVLRLPIEALLTGNFVWVVNAENKLDKHEVKTGIGNWTYTEILSGLNEGDVVVRTPDQVGLEQGRAVTFTKE